MMTDDRADDNYQWMRLKEAMGATDPLVEAVRCRDCFASYMLSLGEALEHISPLQ